MNYEKEKEILRSFVMFIVLNQKARISFFHFEMNEWMHHSWSKHCGTDLHLNFWINEQTWPPLANQISAGIIHLPPALPMQNLISGFILLLLLPPTNLRRQLGEFCGLLAESSKVKYAGEYFSGGLAEYAGAGRWWGRSWFWNHWEELGENGAVLSASVGGVVLRSEWLEGLSDGCCGDLFDGFRVHLWTVYRFVVFFGTNWTLRWYLQMVLVPWRSLLTAVSIQDLLKSPAWSTKTQVKLVKMVNSWYLLHE